MDERSNRAALPLRVATWALLLCLLHAAVASGDVIISSDVSVAIAGVELEDEEIAFDFQSGYVYPAGLGSLPPSTGVDGYHARAGGQHLFSVDVTTTLSSPTGDIVADPGDVVRWDLTEYVLEFDADANGIPAGVNVDAVSEDADGGLVLSFSTTIDLGSIVAEDEDLVRFDGRVFEMVFDGSAAGVAPGLDVDGADLQGDVIVSFDASGSLGGVFFDDQDALRYELERGRWSIVYAASMQHPSWPPGGDVNALQYVPEPGALLMLASGAGLIGFMHRRRSGRGR